MNLMSRLSSDARRARRLRQARAAIRRTERAIAARKLSDPGYDEISNPVFVTVMLSAVAVMVLDIRGVIDTAAPFEWLRSIVAAAGGSL